MILCEETLKQLRIIINGDDNPKAINRSGRDLVNLFNKFGWCDVYSSGFPSRWKYTDEKLAQLNGRPELDKLIKLIFAPVNFVGRINDLDDLISHFNKYLVFDKWQVIRENESITFKKVDKIIIDNDKPNSEEDEDAFLKNDFNINLEELNLEPFLNEIIQQRLKEAEICAKENAPLSSVIIIGSIMEGILLGIANLHPKEFNQATCAPKDEDGKIKKFQEWNLNSLIDAASELGYLKRDVKKFSHVVRDFRNYIHPYSQYATRFTPDRNTALICLQVLKAAIFQLSQHINK